MNLHHCMVEKKSSTMVRACAALVAAVILALCAAVTLANPTQASAAAKEPTVVLKAGTAQQNLPFEVEKMLPGDSVSQDYQVQVTYEGTIDLHFGTEVEKQLEETDSAFDSVEARTDANILDVLKLSVASPVGTVIYDGLLKDATDCVIHLPKVNSATTTTQTYTLTVYLDDNIDNVYQSAVGEADFAWWATSAGAGDLAATGDGMSVLLQIAIILATAATLFLIAAAAISRVKEGSR